MGWWINSLVYIQLNCKSWKITNAYLCTYFYKMKCYTQFVIISQLKLAIFCWLDVFTYNN